MSDTRDEEPWRDPVIEAYKKDVDVTLIDEALKRTYDERLETLDRFVRMLEAARTGRPSS